MAYIERRRVHDADAHIMEPPTWLRDHADPDIRDRLAIPAYANELAQTGDAAAGDAPDPDELDAIFARLADRHRSDEFLADEAADVMNRKNFAATGSFLAEDRPRVLDYIGVDSQLMFNTFHNSRLYEWEHPSADGVVDLDLAYGAARAHNRGMTEFCSVDDRLLPTCYVPLVDFDRAAAMADEAIEMGAAALLVASGCPAGHSPSHRSLDRVWRQAEEAGIPVVFHVGGTGALIDPALLRQRSADPARLPRWRGELPIGRLHGDSVPADADARDDDLRRRARTAPATAHRRDRAGLHLAAELDASRWSPRWTRSGATRSASATCRCRRVSSSNARSG